MSRGRKQTPADLKLLAGNPGKRPINRGPDFKSGAPECPAWLPEDARDEWARITEELVRLGVLALVDMPALSAYCGAWYLYKRAMDDIQKNGLTLANHTKYGTVHKKNPAVNVADRAMMQIRGLGSEFGLTPASRGKIGTKPPADELEEFLKCG